MANEINWSDLGIGRGRKPAKKVQDRSWEHDPAYQAFAARMRQPAQPQGEGGYRLVEWVD